MTYRVYDVVEGELMTLSDVLTQDGFVPVASVLGKKLTEGYSDMMFEEEYNKFLSFSESQTEEEARSLLSTYGEFSLTDTGLIMHYDAYELAPYAAGPIDISITKEEAPGAFFR